MRARVIGSEEAIQSGKGKRKSPAQVILESLDGDFKTMRDMADRYGVHIETMRRLCRATKPDGSYRVKAPSAAVQSGEMTIYLFTVEDVDELDEYYRNKGYIVEVD